jgi:hypothetical protein
VTAGFGDSTGKHAFPVSIMQRWSRSALAFFASAGKPLNPLS